MTVINREGMHNRIGRCVEEEVNLFVGKLNWKHLADSRVSPVLRDKESACNLRRLGFDP